MKITTITTMAALLMGAASAVAQDTAYTKPAGFVTHTLKAGQFNLIGLTLHQPVTVAGDFETVSGTSLSDTDVDFGSTLTAGKTYILEITDAADTELNGHIQEVTVWSNNTITTNDDMDAQGLAVGDKYQLRAASTIADVFGVDNSVGLQGGASATVADNIYLPTDSGFDVYFYSTGGFFGTGWRKDGGGSSSFADQPIFLSDGFYVLRRGADMEMVHTGSVKVTDAVLAITKEYTRVSGMYPVGSTLGSSNMNEDLQGGASATVADQVLIQKEEGGFDVYFYSTGGFFGTGWRQDGGGSVDKSSIELPSAFLIKRVGASDFNLKLSKPASYSNL
ncbi:hypothetical protein JIN77_12030 [Verrucomicrobiaceae bacterium R5-34]|nr:hypothetical protein [Verrucomicrobiaceae bacterium R5-34]